MTEHQKINLYVQVPFCTAKCRFCMFTDKYSVGELTRTGWMPEFVAAIAEEIAQYQPKRTDYVCHSVYFGGGTPSLLSPEQLGAILDSLERKFGYRASVEQFTLEATPESVDVEKLRRFRELGVDRLSIGAQSLNDRHLKQLGRLHTGDEVRRAYRSSRDAGFENVNIDLICALPGQTEAEWREDLEATLALEPDQITVHPLWVNVAPNSSFYRAWQAQTLVLAPVDLRMQMISWAHERLQDCNYRMYILGYYSKNSKRNLFDLDEFRQIDNIIAFGPGATAHLDGDKYKNRASISEYVKGGGRVERQATPLSQGEFFRYNLLLRPGVVRTRFERYFQTRLEDAIGRDRSLRRLVDESIQLGLAELDEAGFRFKGDRFLEAFFHMWGWSANPALERAMAL